MKYCYSLGGFDRFWTPWTPLAAESLAEAKAEVARLTESVKRHRRLTIAVLDVGEQVGKYVPVAENLVADGEWRPLLPPELMSRLELPGA